VSQRAGVNLAMVRDSTKQSAETWSSTHDLALVFFTLAYGASRVLVDEELRTIVEALERWQPSSSKEEVQEVAMEALAVYLNESHQEETVRSIGRLRKILDPESRRRAFEDVVRVAAADGLVLGSDRSMLSILARAWEIKDLPDAQSTDADDGWGILHDVGLMYVAVAHGGDAELSGNEIVAMIECLLPWQPDLEEHGVRRVLREALRLYSTQLDAEDFSESITAIRDAFPLPQRVAVLDDLVHIAESDGPANAHKRDIIAMLSSAWGVGVRLAGAD